MMKQNKVLLLYGGSFDPIHYGHINAVLSAERALISRYRKVNVCLSISNIKHFNKNKTQKTSVEERFDAVKRVTKRLGNNFSAIMEPTHYTFDTVSQIISDGWDGDVCLLIGTDQDEKFKSWHKSEELSTMLSQIAILDKSSGTLTINGEKMNAPLVNISSTEIRNLVASGKINEAKKYVPSEAYELLNQYMEI